MDIEAAKAAFRDYAAEFMTGEIDCDRSLKLKLEHTFRVLSLAQRLAVAENFAPKSARRLAYAALYHDLSRFIQFRRCRSFRDTPDFDHGKESARLTSELPQALFPFTGEERKAVLAAISSHNARTVPADADFILLALRDADKLDIFELTLSELEHPANPDICFGLPPAGRLSPAVGAALAAHESPSHRAMATKEDFIAAKIGWVYDLNFSFSRRYVREQDFLVRLERQLPDLPELPELFRAAKARVEEK